MQVVINDLVTQLPEPSSALSVFGVLQIESTNGYAIAINNRVIPKSTWEKTNLVEGDAILVIQATQGG